HALYAAVSTAPPAEYCAQSRNGTLYATSTGTVWSSAAVFTVLRTAAFTSAGVPSVNHTACDVASIAVTRAASTSLRALARSTICWTAPGLGGGMKKRVRASSARDGAAVTAPSFVSTDGSPEAPVVGSIVMSPHPIAPTAIAVEANAVNLV